MRALEQGVDDVHHLSDYQRVAASFGASRLAFRTPFVVDFPNDLAKKINRKSSSKLIVPLVRRDQLLKKFGQVNRVVSTEELLGFCFKWRLFHMWWRYRLLENVLHQLWRIRNIGGSLKM